MNKSNNRANQDSENSNEIKKINKLDRSIIISNNNQLAQYATRKDLLSAKSLYDESIKEGWANTHTYCGMMNAYVRCGDVSNAAQVFQQLKDRAFEPEVVSYTTMIKGYCSIYNLNDAKSLFNEMINISARKKNTNINPNIRTVNTLLRCCLNLGKLSDAEEIFNKLKDISITPDISSWEYFCSLLCQYLDLDKLLSFVGRLEVNKETYSGLASIQVNIARSASLLHDVKVCNKSLKLASEYIQLDESTVNSVDINEDENDATGGKRPWKGKEDNALRQQSLETYQLHKREELKQDITIISTYINNNKEKSENYFINLIPIYIRTISISNQSTFLNKESLVYHIVESLLLKFGLLKILEKIHNIISNNKNSDIKFNLLKKIDTKKPNKKFNKSKKLKKSNELVDRVVNYKTVFPEKSKCKIIIDKIENLIGSCIDDNIIDFNRLMLQSNNFVNELSNIQSTINLTPTNKPVKLEICSGAGEWIISQAKNDTTSHWMSLELRHDRVYQTFTKTIYNNLSNLTILGGDAITIIPSHFNLNSIDHIFINHPEPPQQSGSSSDSQAKHLLDVNFFNLIAKVLKPNGKITLLTDNLWYAKLLLKQFSTKSFTSDLSSINLNESNNNNNIINSKINSKKPYNKKNTTTSYQVIEELQGIHLYSGKPGNECGHVNDNASSYFDRLWKRDNNNDRYFFYLTKCKNEIAKVKVDKQKQQLKRFGLLENSINQNKNKKMKFEE